MKVFPPVALLVASQLAFSLTIASVAKAGSLSTHVLSSSQAGSLQLSGGTLNLSPANGYTVFTGLGSQSYSSLTGVTITNVGALNTLVGTNNYTLFLSATGKVPSLSGKAGDLRITTANNGNTLKVGTKVAITNSGTGAAKNVTATVYLSDDATLEKAADTKLVTLKLADYVPGATKLRKGETLEIPIKRKVPAAIASYLEGKYLIAELTADAPKSSGLTITAGAPSLSGSSASANPTFTATAASTFCVTRPDLANYFTDSIVPTATLTIASTGEVIDLLPGEEAKVQPGDKLTLIAGTSLQAITDGTWTAGSIGLNLGAGTSTPASVLSENPGHTQTSVVTTANLVVIGPIHLPQ